jgi:hypothetical protein
LNHLRRSLTAALSLGSLSAELRRSYAAQQLDASKSGGDDNFIDGKSVPTLNMESFSLNYELTGAGWAHAKVSVGPSTHETEVSYLTRDPLGLLAQALIGFIWPEESGVFIVNRPGQKPLGAEDFKTRSFIWEDEPGGWQWSLRPHGPASVKVKLEQRSSQAGREPLVDSICPLREMTSACAMSIEALLVKHGIVGYKLDWTYGELPLAQYLLLKRWLQTPAYAAKATEGGTWKEDLTALRLIGG